jgi:ABC-2 type transport system permease protein
MTKKLLERHMSKLRIVIKHEYLTIIKQPSFWIVMLAIPLLVGVVIAISYFGNKSSEDRIQELSKDLKNVSIVDESGLVNAEVVKASGLTLSAGGDTDMLREQVQNGEKEALIVYPEDLEKSKKYQMYLSDDDLTKMNTVGSLASNILKTSLFLPLGSGDVIALAQDGAESQVTTYRDGQETAGFNEYVVPGLFVILFYIVFVFSVGYMLTSVSEEKENRSMEMMLTYVNPRHLIIGKLLAVILVTFTQILFFGLLALVAFLIAQSLGNSLTLPVGIELSKIVFNPVTIFFSVAFLVVGFLMFAGFMTATAAMAPSTKEANGFSSVFYIGAFVPFYFIMMILTDPENPITRLVTFFPLTSPVVTLLRNAVGNIEIVEASLALIVMTFFMVLSIWVAIRAFSRGALEYSSVVSLGALFKPKSK